MTSPISCPAPASAPQAISICRWPSLLTAPPALALAALARCLICVGGETYPPRRESLERLLANLEEGGPARTLGGCRVAVRGGRLLVAPEIRAAAPGKRPRAGKNSGSRSRINRLCPAALQLLN